MIVRDLLHMQSFLEKINLLPRYLSFPVSNFVWKAKAPLKTRGFVWNLALRRINTNDMIQKRHSTMALSSDMCCVDEGTRHFVL